MTLRDMAEIENRYHSEDARNSLISDFLVPGELSQSNVHTYVCNHKTQHTIPMNATYDTEFTSLCEKHLLPFTGRLQITVRRAKYWIGVSNYENLIKMITHIPTTQEMICYRLADALKTELIADSVKVTTVCGHACQALKGNMETMCVYYDTEEK